MDEEIKSLLKVRNNGAHLGVDIVAHIEYFYNTLDCDNLTENPFAHPASYQALLYTVKTGDTPRTRLEMHRIVIHPDLVYQDNISKLV